jgi:hypothetical protein
VGASSSRSLASPTVVARVQDDGSTARRQTLEIAYDGTGTRGNDPSGPQRVAATLRPPGAAAFGAPQLVSEPVGPPGAAANATTVPFAPSAAVDSRVGRRFAAWTTLDQRTHVAVAPAG